MNSFNHYSLGSVGEWLFRHVLGIELDPEVPAYQRFVLRPFVGQGLDHARGSYRSIHGEIRSDWRRDGARLEWRVTIPANTSASVFIPSAPNAAVGTDGLAILERTDAYAVCEAPAGIYTFTSTLALA
jgi:alpha-L-rhamnosidase